MRKKGAVGTFIIATITGAGIGVMGALDELVMSIDRALLLLIVAAVGVFLLFAGMR